MQDFWANLLVAVIVAVISAVLTVQLALRRFRAERWWERKADAYTRILEALHHLKRGMQDDLREIEQHHPEQDEAKRAEAVRKSREALGEVHKAVDTGALILSDDAQKILAKLMSDMSKAFRDAEVSPGYHDAYTGITAELEAVEACLRDLPSIAKRDLAVR